MASIRRVKITFEPPIRLHDEGYAEIISHIQERMAEGEEGATYQATAVMLELEPAAGEPQPLTGELEAPDEAPDGVGKDEDEGAE